MTIDNAIALVTGANRGIGLAFTRELLARGARKVYAGARDPSTVTQPGVVAIRLVVTKPEEVAAAAGRAGDVTLVINNASVGQPGGFLEPDSEEVARRQFETNFFGVLRVSKAFAPVLAAKGGGALLNVLSIISWMNGGQLAAYAASKSAAWSLTNSLRHELAAQNTQVLALHMAFVDTDLVRAIDGPKSSPDEIVKRALDGASSKCWPMSARGSSNKGSRHRHRATFRSPPETAAQGCGGCRLALRARRGRRVRVRPRR